MSSKTKHSVFKLPSTVAMDIPYAISVIPLCLKQFYYVGDYKVDPKSGSKISIGSFLNESALYLDLEQFEELFGIPS